MASGRYLILAAFIVLTCCDLSGVTLVQGAEQSATWDISTKLSKKGESITLTCTVQGAGFFDIVRISKESEEEGDVSILSAKEDIREPFLSTGRFTVVLDRATARTLTLTITDAQEEDTGIYTCGKVSNAGNTPVARVNVKVNGQFHEVPAHLPSASEIWQEYENKINELAQDPSYQGVFEEDELEYWTEDEKSSESAAQYKFPCNNAGYYSDAEYKSPKSVHELTARDIAVVAALGDSITAGNGINARFATGVPTQYRGYSWSVGGEVSYEDGSTTIPNILKHFNPDVTGYSLGNGQADDYYAARLNVAVPGSIARDLPEQAVNLVNLVNEHGLEDKWKMVTLFIGGNDLCRYCQHKEGLSPANHTQYVTTTLDYLHQHLTNAFVNVVGIFDLTILGTIDIGFTCQILHPILCPCGIDAKEEALIRGISKEYNIGERELVDSNKYEDRDDFTVVYQPVMEDMDIPKKKNGKGDLSYMAPDCFHFSRKGHNSVAHFLWNNMWEPVGFKSHQMEYEVDIYCPSPNEYLRTAKNSAAGWSSGQNVGLSSEGGLWWNSLFEHRNTVVYLLIASSFIICITLLSFCLIMRKTPRQNSANNYRPLDENLIIVEPEFFSVAAGSKAAEAMQSHTYGPRASNLLGSDYDYLVDEKTPMME